MSRRVRALTLGVAAVVSVASAAFAQRIWVGGGRFSGEAPKWAKARGYAIGVNAVLYALTH